MPDNPYESPKPATRPAAPGADVAPLTWWEARRLYYNIGLASAGILAFFCYVVVCHTLLPRVLDPSEIEITPFTTLFQGIIYLIMMGVANVLYFLGPLSERVFHPSDVNRYRCVCYRVGFWLSALLPFGIPAFLAFLVFFWPDYWKR
jgi:hypothetical protein